MASPSQPDEPHRRSASRGRSATVIFSLALCQPRSRACELAAATGSPCPAQQLLHGRPQRGLVRPARLQGPAGLSSCLRPPGDVTGQQSGGRGGSALWRRRPRRRRKRWRLPLRRRRPQTPGLPLALPCLASGRASPPPLTQMATPSSCQSIMCRRCAGWAIIGRTGLPPLGGQVRSCLPTLKPN